MPGTEDGVLVPGKAGVVPWSPGSVGTAVVAAPVALLSVVGV